MKTIIKKTLALFLTLIIVTSSLSSCLFPFSKTASREEIAENIEESLEEDRKDFDRVSKYYVYWELPRFDSDKMIWAETHFDTRYSYGDGLPKTLDHAALSATYFLENFYDNIDLSDRSAVTNALITSYVEVLADPYSVYRVPEVSDDYNLDMSGKFGGIGITILYDDENQTLTVESINIDSPAERAGFMVGDLIYAIDDVTVSELGYRNAVNYVRGDVGTEVKITVLRGESYITFSLTRAIIEDKSVDFSVTPDGYGYVRVSAFKENTYGQFVSAVDSLVEAEVSGIVFDMRNNPGGYLDTVCDMISYIIPTGHTIISYKLANNILYEIKSTDDLHPTSNEKADSTLNLPIVVICNGYTASAGEIFTAAVRDFRNDGLLSATIVGTVTYKKGIMQSTYTYKDGSTITLTTAYYNPPCGENYHGIGVTPDVTVENSELEDLQYSQAIAELKKLINANNN